MPEWYWLALLLLGVLFLLMFIGVPAGFAMGLTSVIMILLFLGPNHLIQLANIMVFRGTDFQFLVAPLFVFMAAMVAYSGVAEAAYTAAARWLNRLPGSLALSSTAGCAAFAAVSGSAVATALTIGIFAIPQMLKHGYDKRLAVGSVAAAGTLGVLIPPSISMVIFGVITETSIGQLFIAGIIPGLMLTLLLMAYLIGVCTLKPHLAPPAGSFTWRERFESLKPVWGVLLLFVLVMGSIYTGIATVTEAAAVGVAGAFGLMVVNRQITWERLVDALNRSAQTTAMVMFLLLGGFSLSFVASTLGIAHGISNALVNSGLSPLMVIVLYNILLILLGIPLETSTIVVITMPILFSAFKQMGFDPLWLGVLTTMNGEIGTISPPAGLVLFALKGILPRGISTRDLFMGVLPFNLVLIFALAIVIAFPELATWLPRQMK